MANNDVLFMIIVIILVSVFIYYYNKLDNTSVENMTGSPDMDYPKSPVTIGSSVLKCPDLFSSGLQEYVKSPHSLFILYFVNDKNVVFNAVSFNGDYVPATPPNISFNAYTDNMLCYGDTWFWPDTIDTQPPQRIYFVGDDKTVYLQDVVLSNNQVIGFSSPLNIQDNLQKIIGYDKAFVGKIDKYVVDGQTKPTDFGTAYLVPVYQ